MSRFSRLFMDHKKIFNFFLYFLGLFALKGASFILTPLYTAVFSTEEYGVIELGNSLLSIISTIIGLGLCQYIGIEYFHFKDNERIQAIVKNIKVYLVCSFPVIITILMIDYFRKGLITGINSYMITLICLASFITYFTNLCFMLCKNQQKTLQLTFFQLIAGVITLAMNIIGVCYLQWGIYSILITYIISNGLIMFLIPFVFHFNGNWRKSVITSNYICQVLKISFPLVLSGLVNSVLILGDRWILNYFCSPSEIGIYSLALKFGNIFQLFIVNTLTIFYAPYVYQSFQDTGIVKTEQKNKKNCRWYFILTFLGMLCFIVFIKWIFPLMINIRYSSAQNYLWLIFFSEIFMGATYFQTYLINYKKQTHTILLINLIAMIFNLITNIIFIPRYQIWAAAATTMSSYILMFLISRFYNRRLLKQCR